MGTKLGLALAGVVVALLLVEGGLRVVDRFYCLDNDSSGGFYDARPFFGWGHPPGFSGRAKRCLGTKTEWATYAHINSLGLRDREIPYARTGAYRILLLGDSFTEGLQVADDETFAKQLERRLNAGRRRVEVVNAGHAGYGTDNELLFYRHEGRKYRPDLVVQVFNTENDVLENYQPLLRSIPFVYPDKPYFLFEGGRFAVHNYPLTLAHGWEGAVASVKHALYRNFVAYRLGSSLTLPRLTVPAHAASVATHPPGPLGVLLKDYPPEWDEAWRVTRALERRLRRDVRRDGSRFAVVVINPSYEFSERRWRQKLYFSKERAVDHDQTKAYRLITGFLQRHGIPHIPLLDGFREHLRVTGVDGYHPWDPHWNAVGHALAAELIGRGLDDLQLIPGPDGGGAP